MTGFMRASADEYTESDYDRKQPADELKKEDDEQLQSADDRISKPYDGAGLSF
jgi:hypothetical protein